MLKAMTLTLEIITMQDCNRDMHDKKLYLQIESNPSAIFIWII